MTSLTNYISRTEAKKPEYCDMCDSCISQWDDWTCADEAGRTGDIVEIHNCGEINDVCPDSIIHCPKIKESKKDLPDECQVCKGILECHYGYNKFKLDIDLKAISECKDDGRIK
jgi:hypothetical protein